jgi:hypothetical protein
MQVIQARARSAPSAPIASIAGAGVVGAVCVGLGLVFTYLTLTTPVVMEISRLGQGRIGSVAGALVWALAFLIPGSFVVFGVARLVSAIESSLAVRPRHRVTPVASLAGELPDEYSLVRDVRLPDRRLIAEVVVGPAGLLVVEELPPAEATRHRGPYWEVRLATGRWIPIENPIERAERDAAGIKSWIRSLEEDLSPRMYAAVIADGHRIDRTSEVAVLSREQIPAFLAAMPAIRQMTPERRARITQILTEAS